MTIERIFSSNAIAELRGTVLFSSHLMKDIIIGCEDVDTQVKHFIFPVVRKDRMDFYWSGIRIFSFLYRKGFITHHKFASVLYPIPSENDNAYVSETTLFCFQLISSFSQGYARIKENCSLHSTLESQGITSLYEQFSYINSPNANVVVLDINVLLNAKEDEDINVTDKSNKIDMVTFDKKSKTIHFYKVRHYGNPELHILEATLPVSEQIDHHNVLLSKDEESILTAYCEHIRIINEVFLKNTPEKMLPMPEYMDMNVKLLIFGFDTCQEPFLYGNIVEKLKEYEVYSSASVMNVDLGHIFCES